MKFHLVLFVCLFFMLSCGSDDASVPDEPETDLERPNGEESESPNIENTVVENSENLLLQLNGTELVDADSNPVYLQGVAFNNFIWENSALPPEHHTELDYQRVKDMGMNTIRFYMNYTFFEDDSDPYTYRQSGWDWLDQNIAWAKQYGIYLVLNMHAPQGGYQSQGDGDALWDDVENQNRLSALWKEIAKRYVNEVQIAGFGPVNEPVPNTSIDQWSALAQKLVDNIRSVNKHHLIFLEKAIYVKNAPESENLNFPEVMGQNIVYEFHGYDPYFYTHQLLEFADLGDGGKYPDESIIEVSNSEWYTATFDNPNLAAGDTDWTYFEGVRYPVLDEAIALAVPALVGAEIGGRVYFDDLTVKEYDADGNFVRDVLNMNLNSDDNWYYWAENNTGTGGLATDEGRDDDSSLYIDGATGDSNLSNNRVGFVPQQNYSYEISGWMKGDNVAGTAAAKIRLDFYRVDGPVLTRNKAYLESTIARVVDWAESRNAVLYMGEFGAGAPCFQGDKGGLQWVSDMTGILAENNVHFTYHAYHEDSFGLYLGYGLPNPGNVNQPLIDWFTENLQ